MKQFLFTFIIALALTGCGSARHVTQLVREVQKDTVYLSNIQYDSIYVYQDKYVDRSRDTLYIKDKSIEYRYKMLRDTVRIIQRDSIPYEVTIVETKEIVRPLTLFDHLTRFSFWFVIGALFVLLVRFVFNLKSKLRI